MSDDNKQENMTSLAIAVGRVEECVKGISAQLAEFKADHREDIKFIWADMNTIRENYGNRITNLENTNIERNGSKISLWKIAEVAGFIISMYFAYHMGNLSIK